MREAQKRLKLAHPKGATKNTSIVEITDSDNPIGFTSRTRKLINKFIDEGLDTPSISGYRAWVDDNQASLDPAIQALCASKGVTTPQETIGLRRHYQSEAWKALDPETVTKYEVIAAEVNDAVRSKVNRKCTEEELQE